MTQHPTNAQPGKNDDEKTGQDEETEVITSNARSIAEWTTLAVSIAIIVAFVAVIAWLQISSNGKPAIVSVEAQLEEVRNEGDDYYLPIQVRNVGSQTIGDVNVEATLTSPDGDTEVREFRIDFLVRDEITSGTVIFTHDPANGDLTLSVTSYKVP